MVPKVHATSDPVQIGVADVVMLCVKLWDTEQAIEQIRPMIGPGTAIVSFQHGVLKDQYLRAAFDESQLMGSVGYFATRPGRDAGSPFPTARCGAVAGRLQPRAVAGRADPSRRLAGNAEIARSLDLPLQIGENFDGPKDMLRALQAQACDLVMPDVARIGGVSGWMQAAGVAEAHGIPMSSHLMPEVSAHLLAATPTCHWLEYVDWTDAISTWPLKIENGCWPMNDRPGTGLEWDASAVARYRIA